MERARDAHGSRCRSDRTHEHDNREDGTVRTRQASRLPSLCDESTSAEASVRGIAAITRFRESPSRLEPKLANAEVTMTRAHEPCIARREGTS